MRGFAIKSAKAIGWVRAEKMDWCPVHAKARAEYKRAEKLRKATDKAALPGKIKKAAADVLALYKEATAKLIAESADVPVRAAKRALAQLQREGVIKRAGKRGFVLVAAATEAAA